MDVVNLDAKPREGKKSAKLARREGFVPCILYGQKFDPLAFQLADLDMHRLVFTNERNILDIKVGKKSYECILKSVDFHPVTDKPIHADFQILQKGQKITLTVPLKFEGKPVGQIQEGGEVQFIMHDIEIESLPKNIPDHIEIDISELHLGQTLHVADVSAGDFEIVTPAQRSVVAVVAPRKEEVEEVADELLEGVEEGEEGAEGVEAAAPAEPEAEG